MYIYLNSPIHSTKSDCLSLHSGVFSVLEIVSELIYPFFIYSISVMIFDLFLLNRFLSTMSM